MKTIETWVRAGLFVAACAALALCLAGCGKEEEEGDAASASDEVALWRGKYEEIVRKNEEVYGRIDALKDRNSKLDQQIKDLDAQLDKAKEANAGLAEVDKLKETIAQRNKAIEQMRAEAETLKGELKRARDLVNATDSVRQLEILSGKAKLVKEKLLALGAQTFEEGQYAAGSEILAGAVELGAGGATVLYQLAYCCAEVGDNEGAARWYAAAAQAAEKDPEAAQLLPKLHNNHGAVLVALGKHDEALKAYLKAAEADKDYAPVHFNLGRLYALHLKAPDKAMEAYRRHVALGGARSIAAREAIKLVLDQQRPAEKVEEKVEGATEE